MAEPIDMSLVEAADAVRAGRVSARELTQACLQRIERLQPKLNAFISIDAEDALQAADRADAARKRGDTLGPLHGVPLAHKDMYYRAGKVSTCGSKIRRDFRPDYTATVIERIDAAGAIHLGGLNMSEFAFGPTGHNAHWRPARNPWNPEHVTGGSSSGSGSAVAGRLAFGALGSDTGGSIRLPAGFCGIAGIKPTQGRVSRYGAMGLSFSLDCVGPLARTVRDCARLLGVIAGSDERDATCSRLPVPDYESATVNADVKGVRIGVPKTYYYEGCDADVQALLQASLRRFSELGAEVIEVDIPDQNGLSDLGGSIVGPESATLHGAWLKERPQDYGPQVRARLEPGLAVPATWYLHALQIRPAIAQPFRRDRVRPLRRAARAGAEHAGAEDRRHRPRRLAPVPGRAGAPDALHPAVQLSRPARPVGARRLRRQRPADRVPARRPPLCGSDAVPRRRGLRGGDGLDAPGAQTLNLTPPKTMLFQRVSMGAWG